MATVYDFDTLRGVVYATYDHVTVGHDGKVYSLRSTDRFDFRTNPNRAEFVKAEMNKFLHVLKDNNALEVCELPEMKIEDPVVVATRESRGQTNLESMQSRPMATEAYHDATVRHTGHRGRPKGSTNKVKSERKVYYVPTGRPRGRPRKDAG